MRKVIEICVGLLVMIFMGSVYAYSVFREDIRLVYQVNLFLSGLPYMVALLFYAVSMFVTGRLIRRNNVRLISFIGLSLIVLGFYLASESKSIWSLTISYGIIVGFGVVMVYTVPVFRIQQFGSKHAGLLTGFVLLGFGVSPVITAPLISYFLSFGLTNAFRLMALIFVLIIPLMFVYNNDVPIKRIQHQLPKDRVFFKLYVFFMLSISIGLMMIGLSMQIGLAYGYSSRNLSILLTVFALGNGISRPLFGYFHDRFGFTINGFILLIVLITSASIGLINQGSYIGLFVVSFSLFWFSLGGLLSLMPQVIKTIYGIDRYASYFGVMFTSYGVAAIVGHLSSGLVLDMVSSTSILYLVILCIVFMAFITLISIRKETKRND